MEHHKQLYIGLGFENGSFAIDLLKTIAKQGVDENLIVKARHQTAGCVTVLKYLASFGFLAVGTSQGDVFLFNIQK